MKPPPREASNFRIVSAVECTIISCSPQISALPFAYTHDRRKQAHTCSYTLQLLTASETPFRNRFVYRFFSPRESKAAYSVSSSCQRFSRREFKVPWSKNGAFSIRDASLRALYSVTCRVTSRCYVKTRVTGPRVNDWISRASIRARYAAVYVRISFDL